MKTFHLSEAEIIQVPNSSFIGQSQKMSLLADKTPELWQNFMRTKKEMDAPPYPLYSIQVFPPAYFRSFQPQIEFEKWAAIPCSSDVHVPLSMDKFDLPSGLYAKFIYTGKLAEAFKALEYIFNEWIPPSMYEVDYRPHLSVMDERYQPESAESVEAFWIPIRER